ncbi:MAG: TolC family protein [Bacteroidetes bacterium]|nr:TolC family protein [Bacteroidota bacterium]
MIQYLKYLILPIFLLLYIAGNGQTQNLSLQDAVNYALSNHPDIKNKVLGEKYAKAQVDETTAYGIPQVSGNIQFMNNVKKQVFAFPDFVTGKNKPISIGTDYSTTVSINATWLALDASYFLGLKASKAFVEITKHQTNQSKIDITANVIKSYYLVLITKENIELIKQNVKTLEEILFQTENYYKNGFAEKIDVDRLNLSLSNLKVQLENLTEQEKITEQLLKFNMGMPVETSVFLTDNLENIYSKSLIETEGKFDPKNRVEYKLLNAQLDLNKIDKKRYEMIYFPNLVFFSTYQQNKLSDEFEFNNWIPNSFWGFKIGIPIFSGLANRAQHSKRVITMEQTLNNIKMFENASTFEANQAKTKYLRSVKTIEIQKKNLDLANEILEIASKKLKEGVGSNLEITNAQQEVKTSQTNYLNAIYDLLNAEIELKKAYGNL